jgi:hypothetical protein
MHFVVIRLVDFTQRAKSGHLTSGTYGGSSNNGGGEPVSEHEGARFLLET